jgi:hypothetical protein
MRTPVARSRQMLGEVPACGPYYNQPGLPRVSQPGSISPDGTAPHDNRARFRQFNSIVAPAAGTSNAVITQYTVPDGHQSGVLGLMLQYVATVPPGGFIQGDATVLFFSLRLNGAQFIRNYQTIPNTLGSFDSGPWPIPGKIKLFAGDLLEILATVPGGSGLATGGTNRLHGHLVGFEEPIQ